MHNLYIRYIKDSKLLHERMYLNKNQKRIFEREHIENFSDIDDFGKYPSVGNVYLRRLDKKLECIVNLEAFLFNHILLLTLDDAGFNWRAISNDKTGPFRGILPGRNNFVGYLLAIEELIESKKVKLTHDIVIILDDDYIKAMYLRYEDKKGKKKKLLIRYGG